MYLKRLELKGFKSFPKKTQIVFEKGITSIVGPNGSGKSNISDAIRWILGEQSIKSLRADKLEDVIFSGTNDKKGMNYCEASLTIDNSDKILDIDYSEVNIKRVAYKSGESQFYLNNKQCRLKDIKELLLDTGIAREGYSVVEQGKIDDILSTSSNNRRKIFDEACGISKYRYKKMEGEKNLQTAKENLDRINDVFCEIEGQLKPLEVQRDKAIEYEKLSESLKILQVNNYIKEIQMVDTNLKQLNKHKDVLTNQINNLENKKVYEKEMITKVENHLKLIQNKINENKDYIFELKNELSLKKSSIELLNEKLKNFKNDNDRINLEIDEVEKGKTNSEVELKKLIDINLNHSIELEKLDVDINNHKENINNYLEKINIDEKLIESLKDELINSLNEKNTNNMNLTSNETNLTNLKDRKKHIDLDLDKINLKLKKLNESIEKLRIDKCKCTCELNELNDKKKDFKLSYNKLLTEIENINEAEKKEYTQLNNEKSKLDIYLDMENDYEGFNKGVRNILKNKSLSGVIGAFAQLIQVPKEYETAVEVSMGFSLQNIVVKCEQDAKCAINYLKKNNLGRVTFLPCNVIKGKTINVENLKNEEGFIGLASDKVIYDFEFENIIKYALGRTIIVKDINSAISIGKKTGYSFKMVTLEGEIFNPGGSLTGGSLKSNSSNLLSRKRLINETKEKIELLDKTLNDVILKKENIKKNIIDKKSEIDCIILEIHKKEKQMAIISLDKNNLKQEIINSKNDKEKINRENYVIDENITHIKAFIQENIASINLLDEKYIQIENKIKKLINKNSFEKDRYEEYVKCLNDLNVKKAKISQVYQNQTCEIKRLKNEIKDKINLIKSKQEFLQKCFLQIEKTQTDLLVNKVEIEDINNNVNNAESKLKTQNEQENTANENYKTKNKILFDLNCEIETLKDSLHKIEFKIERFNIMQENHYDKLWDEYELTFKEALNLKNDNLILDKKSIENIKSNLKKLGHVNMNSIKEYELVKQRYDFYLNQKGDLEKSINAIENIIKDLEFNMKNQFAINFDKINKTFECVYQRLFGGGYAKLRLYNECEILDSDIEIVAKPPGKNLKNINLLSGGEKALTAICVLFAILLNKPTPFCILDEIEAPLDDANIFRFASFLKELSSNTQFVIITHRRGTMQISDYIYGVTMQEKGISNVVSLKLEDAKTLDEKNII